MQGARVVVVVVALVAAVLAAGVVHAEEAFPPAPVPEGAEPAVARPMPGMTPGPATIDLGHDLSLDLAEPYAFLEKDVASSLLESMGSFHHDDLVGIVVPKVEAPWFAVVHYDDDGYVEEDEPIDADDLLKQIRKGVKAQNEEREERGFPPLEVRGWVEPPRYDPARHHLVWGLDVAGSEGASVNYSTRALGRRGVLSLNLVTAPESLQADKTHAATLLAATRFGEGARYEDYREGDKVAEYGLAGLILAGAGLGAIKLVKAGFVAAFLKPLLVTLLAAKKLVIAIVIGALALLRKLFGGRSSDAAPPPSVPPPLPPPT